MHPFFQFVLRSESPRINNSDNYKEPRPEKKVYSEDEYKTYLNEFIEHKKISPITEDSKKRFWVLFNILRHRWNTDLLHSIGNEEHIKMTQDWSSTFGTLEDYPY